MSGQVINGVIDSDDRKKDLKNNNYCYSDEEYEPDDEELNGDEFYDVDSDNPDSDSDLDQGSDKYVGQIQINH